jgi:hypothetical protein
MMAPWLRGAAMPPLDPLSAPGEGWGARAVLRVPGGKRLSPLGRVLVTLLVLVLLVIAARLTAPWGFIALGAAVGVLVVARVGAAQAALMPVAALGWALLPLVLPLFVFAAAGVVKSPPELQFAVGLVTLLLAASLIRPDWARIKAVIRRQPRYRSFARGVGQVGVPILIAAVVLIAIAGAVVELLGESDETSRSLFVAAVGLLAAAAVLRVIGYGRTAFRAAVALALLVLMGRLAADIGLAGGWADTGSTGTAALVAAGLLALTALVELVAAILGRTASAQSGLASDQLDAPLRAAVLLETPVAARWVTDRMSIAGLACAVLSSLLLLCAVFAASHAGGAQEDLANPPAANQRETRPADMTDARLAETYSPVLLFTADQRWTPIAVDSYVSGATLTDWEGRSDPIHSVGELPTTCPGVVRAPCYSLRQECPHGAAGPQCAEALPDDKAVYVRVARREQWEDCADVNDCADGSPNPFARARGRYAADTEILLQYWFFYPYNEWVAPVAIGSLKELHPADWEAVTVGLSSDGPLWVAYSAHCAGSYADWKQVRVASEPTHRHPLVAVAVGSQANYRVAKESRVPNFAECSGITQDRIKLLSYAANIRDRTDDATTWAPAPADLRLVDARTAPMSFRGTWSPWARMVLENLRKSIRLGPDGAGPASPPLQPLWQRPMNAIFGGGAWKAA